VHLDKFLPYKDVFACKFLHRWTCLYATCYIISYVELDRHVSTQCVVYDTCSCACLHTKRRVSTHILTYEDMSMHNFQHMTPCLSRNFSQVHLKQPTTSRLFNLRTFLTMQLLTYKLCANCHIWGRVCLQRVTKFLTYLDHHVSTQMCRLRDVFMCVFAH